ncbi:hypothetical protein HDV57DRAFT_355902 [Trichoderma longibrachiatum]
MQSFRLPSVSSRLVSLALLMLRWLFGRSGTASGWWRFGAAQPVGRLHLAVRRSNPCAREQLAFDRLVGERRRDLPSPQRELLSHSPAVAPFEIGEESWCCAVRCARPRQCRRGDDGGCCRGHIVTFAAS